MIDHPYVPGNYDDCCNDCGEPREAHREETEEETAERIQQEWEL